MEKLYIAVDLGLANCRVTWGALAGGRLTMGEVCRFENTPVRVKDDWHWDVARIYQGVTDALRQVGDQEVCVSGVSCHGWPSDYMLFGKDGSLLTPVERRVDLLNLEGMKKACAQLKWEIIYDESAVQRLPGNTLFQLASGGDRRLKRAVQLMPIGDGFNHLLSGVRCVEVSSASATQLYNPVIKGWSPKILQALGLPIQLFPQIVQSGTKLGLLRPELAKETKLEDARVVATCSNATAAALAAVPAADGEEWAYLRIGSESFVGAEVDLPLINEVTRELGYSNEISAGGINFNKRAPGLWILDECRRFWTQQDRELGGDVLLHLATTCTPFESLINPTDARFYQPGDMPAKVQAFCRETEQEVPRKPGQIARCVLESLALHYRKLVQELSVLTGRAFTRFYLFGGDENILLNHLLTNALQVPVVLVSSEAAAIGNVVLQARALGQIKSQSEAHEVLRGSFKQNIIIPHRVEWDAAYDRFIGLVNCAPTPA